MRMSDWSSTIFWKYCAFPILVTLSLCLKLIDHVHVGLCVDSLLFYTAILSPITPVLVRYSFIGNLKWPDIFKICYGYFWTIASPFKFLHSLLIFTKVCCYLHWDYVESISLGGIDILTISTLLIHDYDVFFHLFRLSLTSFSILK